MTPYRFDRPARSRAAYITLAIALGLWLGLGLISAHWLLIVVFALPPALLGWELWHNTTGHLELTGTTLSYDSGRQQRQVPLEQIDRVRLLRRMDFSWMANLVLTDGRKVRLPPNCTPPVDELERELTARGVRTERILFSLTG